MSDQPRQRDDVEELREAAREMGVQDVEGKDTEQLVEDAQEAQADSAASPTNPAGGAGRSGD
jgi:hypothetical protein